MNVNSNIPSPHFHVAGNATPFAAGNGTRTEGTRQAENDASLARSGDARFLLNQLEGVSDIRDDVVSRAAERLDRGDYLTDESAEAAADAILNRLA
jgi:hypothetical protein